MGPCILEVHEICAIFGQVHGFIAIWPNKFLSGEFRVFRGKWSLLGFGCCHGNLAVK